MPTNPLGVALRSRRAGQHTLAWARPELQAPENFTLTSPPSTTARPSRKNTEAGCCAPMSHPPSTGRSRRPAPLSSC